MLGTKPVTLLAPKAKCVSDIPASSATSASNFPSQTTVIRMSLQKRARKELGQRSEKNELLEGELGWTLMKGCCQHRPAGDEPLRLPK